MSDNDGKKTSGSAWRSASGQVKQSFSHGRTKNVVVETKRKRVVVPKPGAGKPAGCGQACADRRSVQAARRHFRCRDGAPHEGASGRQGARGRGSRAPRGRGEGARGRARAPPRRGRGQGARRARARGGAEGQGRRGRAPSAAPPKTRPSTLPPPRPSRTPPASRAAPAPRRPAPAQGQERDTREETRRQEARAWATTTAAPAS